MINRDKNSYVPYILELQKNRVPHEITCTNRTQVVKASGSTFNFTGGGISKTGMNFIQKVSGHVKANLENLQHLESFGYDSGVKLKRLDFNPKIGNLGIGKYEGVSEIDLSKAYWVSANEIGVIDDELCAEGLDRMKNGSLSKIEVLASLGSLAKQKRRFVYNVEREEYDYSLITDSSDTRFLWDAISLNVDIVMDKLKKFLGDDFLFYWTDAVFFSYGNRSVSDVTNFIRTLGFDSKAIEIEYVSVDFYSSNSKRVVAWTKEKKGGSDSTLIDDDGNFGRPFPLSIKNSD